MLGTEREELFDTLKRPAGWRLFAEDKLRASWDTLQKQSTTTEVLIRFLVGASLANKEKKFGAGLASTL